MAGVGRPSESTKDWNRRTLAKFRELVTRAFKKLESTLDGSALRQREVALKVVEFVRENVEVGGEPVEVTKKALKPLENYVMQLWQESELSKNQTAVLKMAIDKLLPDLKHQEIREERTERHVVEVPAFGGDTAAWADAVREQESKH